MGSQTAALTTMESPIEKPCSTQGDSEGEDPDADEFVCVWPHDRHELASLARKASGSSLLEAVNIAFISVFLLIFVFVELRWAREKQYRPLVLLLSPLAIILTTV